MDVGKFWLRIKTFANPCLAQAWQDTIVLKLKLLYLGVLTRFGKLYFFPLIQRRFSNWGEVFCGDRAKRKVNNLLVTVPTIKGQC